MKSYGIYKRQGLSLYDLIAIILLAFFVYGVVATARRWTGDFSPSAPIRLELQALPLYGVYSLFRACIAYALSFAFTIGMGYWAARNTVAEKIIIPLLDIGQSIPVLGFLPGLVLGLISLFPKNNFGLELACIIMIFTGQVWNMTFSFYSSLKAIPVSIEEMSTITGLSRMNKLYNIEMPYAATGLAWNSLMSMAGGWFFLTVCEAFTLEDKNFRVPGLGSYMAAAIEADNHEAMLFGILAMFVVIISMDFLIWRPIIAWTSKFRLDDNLEGEDTIPFMGLLLTESPVIQEFMSAVKKIYRSIMPRKNPLQRALPSRTVTRLRKISRKNRSVIFYFFVAALSIVAFALVGKIYNMIITLQMHEVRLIAIGTIYTFLRVLFAVILSSLWTVPVGILIGLSSKLTKIMQPLIQITASFPAPMLFPLALVFLSSIHIKMGMASSLLIFLSVQWYVLFNVLAGAMSISHEMRDSFSLIGVSRWHTWKKLYLPSIFPSLVTGWITAAGGAWNASIVAEYTHLNGVTMSTLGLGALISQATAHANYDVLTAALIMMTCIVVILNRFVWQPLLQFSETRFRLD